MSVLRKHLTETAFISRWGYCSQPCFKETNVSVQKRMLTLVYPSIMQMIDDGLVIEAILQKEKCNND